MDRDELFTFTENVANKQLGIQIYWDDNGRLEVKFDSFNWKFPNPFRIQKMVYHRRRNEEEINKSFESRTLWKDKSLLLLDQAGNIYRLDGYWWHKAPIKMQNNCLDIVTHSDKYIAMHLNGESASSLHVDYRTISPQTFQVSLIYEPITWPKVEEVKFQVLPPEA